MVGQKRAAGGFIPAVERFVGEETPTIVEGQGAMLTDTEGNEYIDLHGQHGVLSVGYSHPAVNEAIVNQVEKIKMVCSDFPTEISAELTRLLAEKTPGDLEYSYFVNSGSEAVEVALSLARKATDGYEFLCLGEGFHGRSYGARSLVGYSGYREGFGPFLPVSHVPSHNCDSFPGDFDPEDGAEYAEILEYVLQYHTSPEDVAAFIAEPILGTGGNIPAPEGYFKRIREICDEHDILFIADEVITGFGRTGEWFGCEQYGVEPDIMTTAKAIGGGMPIGATVATPEVAETFEGYDYFSTFGGNPVSTSAAVATIETIESENLVTAAEEKGEYFKDQLAPLQEKHDVVGEIEGMGLLIGVGLYDDGEPLAPELGMELRRLALERGVILPAKQGWNGNRIRLNPPLTISKDQIDETVSVIDECLAAIEG